MRSRLAKYCAKGSATGVWKTGEACFGIYCKAEREHSYVQEYMAETFRLGVEVSMVDHFLWD